jgi:hypothetical protein
LPRRQTDELLLAERASVSESDPIRVHAAYGRWLIDYGSYVQGYYETRAEAIEVATAAALAEGRELTIERA